MSEMSLEKWVNKMLHNLVIGRGSTKESAAMDFVDKLITAFPKEVKVYSIFMRKPLEYRYINSFDLGGIHEYSIRISWKDLEETASKEGE